MAKIIEELLWFWFWVVTTCVFEVEGRGHHGFFEGLNWILVFGCFRFLMLVLLCWVYDDVWLVFWQGWSHKDPFRLWEFWFDGYVIVVTYILFWQPLNIIPCFFFFFLTYSLLVFLYFYIFFYTNVSCCTLIDGIFFFLY